MFEKILLKTKIFDWKEKSTLKCSLSPSTVIQLKRKSSTAFVSLRHIEEDSPQNKNKYPKIDRIDCDIRLSMQDSSSMSDTFNVNQQKKTAAYTSNIFIKRMETIFYSVLFVDYICNFSLPE